MLLPVFARNRKPSFRSARPRGGLARTVLSVLIAAVVIGGLAGIAGSCTGGGATGGRGRVEAQEVPQRMLWGIGNELEPARATQLYRDGGANMATAWFNGRGDLDWMSGYDGSVISDMYGAGKALELVVWLGNEPDYAVSEQFQADIRTLTRLHKGSGPNYGPLYVVLFTEFETYGDGGVAYRNRLMEAYRRAVPVVHSEYDQARVALGFGGYAWNGAHDRDLAEYHDEIAASDYTAVQHMQACDSEVDGQNIIVPKIRSAVKQLGAYGKPVMISHFKLWGDRGCQRAAFDKFSREMFTTASLNTLIGDGLFAWDFMADYYIDDPGPVYDSARALIDPHIGSLPPSPHAPAAGLP